MRLPFRPSAALLVLILVGAATVAGRAAATDIVLYASDADVVSGAWTRVAAPTAAGGTMLSTANAGWAAADAPLATPGHAFEISFDAVANTPYQVWMRLRAADDSKWNDSVWVQFDDAVDAGGSALWPIGSTSALLINLEDCGGCGLAGWGWQDNAWWTGQTARVRFPTAGRRTMRVQVREDGVAIDQIILSPATWLTSAPGPVRNDTTIVPKPAAGGTVTVVREPYLQQVTGSSAIVVWAARENRAADVRYDLGSSSYTAPAAGRLVTAAVNGMGFDYYQYESQLTRLTPGATVTYWPRMDGVALSGGDRFVAAPAPGTGTVRFIAFGDSGIGSPEQRQLAARMSAESFDFAVHTGDVAYGSSATWGAGSYPQLQKWFFDIYRDWLRSRPIYPSIGNHDNEAGNAAPFRDVFVLPGHGASAAYPDHARRFYSFDYGAAHVVVLDTELAFQNTARRQAQIDWLRADLTATTQPWKIAVFHRSPYSAGGEHGSDLAVRAAFAPLFDELGVALVLSGHEHDYERTTPIRQTANGFPTVYVVTGGGGARLYPAGSAWWTAASASAYHYVRGLVTSCRIELAAVGLDGIAFDAAVLDRCTPATPPGATPYGGKATALPGLLEAEHFDEGGSGVAYFDTTPGNAGGQFRATDVDIQATSDAGGGYNIGWMRASEWLSYSVNIVSGGTFNIEARVASNGPGGTFHVEVAGIDVTGPLVIPNTGGHQNWTTIARTGIALNPGAQRLRIVLDANNAAGSFGNLNYLRVTPAGATPFGGAAAVVPGVIEAERFDEGGQGVGYRDTTPGNSGGQYRATDVDIEATADAGGGYNVGWISAGEWLAYAIDVSAAGTYTLDARVAASGQGGTFHVEIDGVDATGPITIPNTGGWQKWVTVSRPGIALPAGRHSLRVVFDAPGPTGVLGNLNYLRMAVP